MKTLTEISQEYYTNHGFNCSESILHAGNDYYQLGLHDEDMKILSGFGSGMYVGSTCGALVACNAVLSKLIVEEKAHDHLDALRPAAARLVRNFKNSLSHSDCAKIKPVHYSKEKKCFETVSLASNVLDQTIRELCEEGILDPEIMSRQFVE